MPETVPSATDSEAPRGDPVAAADDCVLAERLAAIEARLGALNDRAAHREAVIDRLHREKEELRRGERRLLLEPVVADLIRMHDSLTVEAARAYIEEQPAHAELLRSFAGDVEMTLDRCGIETLTAEPGARHSSGEHRVVAVLPTDAPERHNTIAEVVGMGFRDRDTGRVRRPLLARFHRFGSAGADGSGTPAGTPDIVTAGDEPAAG
jgi:molecular chaperone GrpE (heat shock protein)